ncbi:restriction endonuclease subunit S [Kitasatospora sp. NPDC056076]|uniref:restriction endonuclease subunit S n=1 Tax=Kitasatospora sp. NPDC056076 TaxID=3345703 RepID=UPI0035D9833E
MSSVLGVPLPNSWSSAPLKHVTSVLSRGSAPDYVDVGPVRAISQASNQASGLDWPRTRFHDFSGNPKSLKGYLRPNDVLINSTGTGTLGRVGYFTDSPDGLPCMADSHVTIARAKPDELDARFSYYWLSSKPFQEYVYAALVVGATNQIELNRDRLGDAPVPLPPLDEQRRIGEFLDAEIARIDKMCTTVRRLKVVLHERRDAQRALMLRGADRSGPRMPHPMLGDLPASWQVIPLKRLVPRIGVGVVVDPSSYFTEDGVPFLRGSNITESGIDLAGVRFMSEANSRTLWRSRLNSGDVVVIRAGYPGRAAVVPDGLDGANCASLLVIKRGKHLLPKYLEAYFNSPLGTAYVNSVRYGAAQEQINVSHVVDFMVPAPGLDEQEDIIQGLEASESPIQALKEKLSRQEVLLKERRQALITAAVTGQFDVTTASGRNVTEGVSA